jgi:hypothetical protein
LVIQGVADFGKAVAMFCDAGLDVNKYKCMRRSGQVPFGKKRKPEEGEESWLFRALVRGPAASVDIVAIGRQSMSILHLSSLPLTNIRIRDSHGELMRLGWN